MDRRRRFDTAAPLVQAQADESQRVHLEMDQLQGVPEVLDMEVSHITPV